MHRIRFRPSANGYLHLGGAYTAWQCWKTARSKNGQFVLLVDDVCVWFKHPLGSPEADAVGMYGAAFVRDLTWLGMEPDRIAWASGYQDAHFAAAERLGLQQRWYGEHACLQRYVHTPSSGTMTTYSPWLTLGRVTDDHELGITGFVRGADLLSEADLYDHFARTLYGEGYSIIQDYVATIIEPEGNTVCSKSQGTASIADYREAGVEPEQIVAAFADMETMPLEYGNQCTGYRRVKARYLQTQRAS